MNPRFAMSATLVLLLLFGGPTYGSESLAVLQSISKERMQADRELEQWERSALRFPEDKKKYQQAAQSAWNFVNSGYRPATGFVDSVRAYPFTTIWDVGSGIGALYCAHELGLVSDSVYDTRMRRVLETLRRADLYDRAAFNKVYSTRTGAMAARNGLPSRVGYGWSAADIGRLLVWLKVMSSRQPQYADLAKGIVARLQPQRLVANGYVWGESVEGTGTKRYVEGRLGYEQYSARGFDLWGMKATKALDLRYNAVPINVLGHRLFADVRGQDRLTSEPLVLLGLEVGWTDDEELLARELLAAQESRAKRTGRITLLSEDAINRPPYFFYYYCAYANGKEFAIDVQDPHAVVDGPRWVSTKAAFGWDALLPSAYTHRALDVIQGARTASGWGSGVYEENHRPTGSLNVNTAAVVLEAALFAERGIPALGTKASLTGGTP